MPDFDPKELALCAYCPRLCRHACPTAMGESRETLIPTHKIGLLQWWQEGRLPLDRELAEVFYACTHCGGCTATCVHGQTPADMLYRARQEAVDEGIVPEAVDEVIHACSREGHPYGVDSPERTSLPYDEDAPIQFLPGEAMGWRVNEIKAMASALESILGRRVSILPPQVTSGMIPYATGDRGLTRMFAERLIHHVRKADQLVVAEPFCEQYLREHFHQTGLSLPVSVSLLFVELSTASFTNRSADWLGLNAHTLYHDPAPLGRNDRWTAMPRELLSKLGYRVVDFVRHRHHTSATGAGGIYRWTSPQGARNNASWILREVFAVQKRLDAPSPPAVVTVGEASRSLLADSEPSLTVLDLNVLLSRTIAG